MVKLFTQLLFEFLTIQFLTKHLNALQLNSVAELNFYDLNPLTNLEDVCDLFDNGILIVCEMRFVLRYPPTPPRPRLQELQS